ncbi:uncharacterized protein F4822DRAFT_274653 [Hypoxylon trugodes]|uniref:uncharacterized protein n=1 Tax=Hypoxylon trugodes TaxID=326681 RepID=UPI00219A6AB3|nr:uncharacterized protein F4822DRAFT_274653 [Hypoxylon trugodes]KAI1387129.1 hypothetical protein F4822DRAFT_274653 [Hypoxylon trugodes]
MIFPRECFFILPLLTIAGANHGPEVHDINKRSAQESCAEISKPSTFTISNTQYIKVEGRDPIDPMLNSTTIAFEVVNNANGVTVGCSRINVMHDGKYPDDSKYWSDCQDLSLEVDGTSYPLTTNANFLWNEWKLSVNQSWNCGGATVRHISTVTLSPTCNETRSPYQYLNECSAPKVESPARSQ